MNAHQRRKAFRAWHRRAVAHVDASSSHVTMAPSELDRLREYSTTIPTGAKPGDRWKVDTVFKQWCARRSPVRPPRWMARRHIKRHWVLGEVLDQRHPEGGWVIRWSVVKVVEPPDRP